MKKILKSYLINEDVTASTECPFCEGEKQGQFSCKTCRDGNHAAAAVRSALEALRAIPMVPGYRTAWGPFFANVTLNCNMDLRDAGKNGEKYLRCEVKVWGGYIELALRGSEKWLQGIYGDVNDQTITVWLEGRVRESDNKPFLRGCVVESEEVASDIDFQAKRTGDLDKMIPGLPHDELQWTVKGHEHRMVYGFQPTKVTAAA